MTNANDLIYGAVSDRGDGSYFSLFTVETAANYELSALLGTSTILQSVPVQIAAGYPSTSQIALNSPIPARANAGLDIYLAFQFRDQYSNTISDCSNISASVSIFNGTVQTTNKTLRGCVAGFFNQSIAIFNSGSYLVFVNWRWMDVFGSILGSPFSCTVVSSTVDPAQCTAESRYLRIGQKEAVEASSVGMRRDVTIAARDSWGNSVQNDPFSVIENFFIFLEAMGQRCCNSSSLLLLHTAELEGLGGPLKHMMNVTEVKI